MNVKPVSVNTANHPAAFISAARDYDQQEQQLAACTESESPALEQPWVDKLLTFGHLIELDRYAGILIGVTERTYRLWLAATTVRFYGKKPTALLSGKYGSAAE